MDEDRILNSAKPIESVTNKTTGKEGKGDEVKSTSPIKSHLPQKNNDHTEISQNVTGNSQETYISKETKVLESSSNKTATALSNPPKYTNISVNNKDKIKLEFSDKQNVNKSIQSKVLTRKYIY